MPAELCEPTLETEPLSELEIIEWNEEFPHITPEERIEQTCRRLGNRVITASTFRPTAPYLLDLAERAAPEKIPVVTSRHHHETQETLRLMSWYRDELDLDHRIYDAEPMAIPPVGSSEFSVFQHIAKVEPFQRAIDELKPLAYFSGRMRWQSDERADLPFVESRGSLVVVNPIADASEKAVQEFFEENDWPQDPNYHDPTKGPDQNLECQLNKARYS
jgi:phosphoadenosine phosphosulfate reductase